MEQNNPALQQETEKENGLTPDKLRQFPGLETVNDTDAVEIIAQLKELSRLLYQINAVPENIYN